MRKAFSLGTYVRATRRLVSRFGYDPDAALQEQRELFAKYGVDYDEAVRHLDVALEIAGLPPYREESSMCSQHWIFFAGLAQQLPEKPRILEIGTYQGRFTQVLAAIYPGAEIVTCDLPDDSPTFLGTYDRASRTAHARFVNDRDAGLAKLPNAEFVQANSFLLSGLLSGRQFDAVWVDGNHDYPDVAWDACNAYHLTTEGGYILFDDIFTKSTRVSRRMTPDFNDSYALTRTLSSEGLSEFSYIVKRLTPAASADRSMRKHIAVTVKKRLK